MLSMGPVWRVEFLVWGGQIRQFALLWPVTLKSP